MLWCLVTQLFLERRAIVPVVGSRSFFLSIDAAMPVMISPHPLLGSDIIVWRLAMGIVLITIVQKLSSKVFLVELLVIVLEARLQ